MFYYLRLLIVTQLIYFNDNYFASVKICLSLQTIETTIKLAIIQAI